MLGTSAAVAEVSGGWPSLTFQKGSGTSFQSSSGLQKTENGSRQVSESLGTELHCML